MLELCRAVAADEPDAAVAIAQWGSWQLACERRRSRGERRFRRRAYERARDRALMALLMRTQGPKGGFAGGPGEGAALTSGCLDARVRPANRLAGLLRQEGRSRRC